MTLSQGTEVVVGAAGATGQGLGDPAAAGTHRDPPRSAPGQRTHHRATRAASVAADAPSSARGAHCPTGPRWPGGPPAAASGACRACHRWLSSVIRARRGRVATDPLALVLTTGRPADAAVSMRSDGVQSKMSHNAAKV